MKWDIRMTTLGPLSHAPCVSWMEKRKWKWKKNNTHTGIESKIKSWMDIDGFAEGIVLS